MEKIYFGSDHGGYKLKNELIEFVKELGYEAEDVGCDSEESCDYPEYAKKLAEAVVDSKAKGVLVCGTGIGMSIAANKVKGARAALVYDEYTTKMSREHNNSNIVCFGERTSENYDAKKLLKLWLETPFSSEERHHRRVDKIMEIEE